MRPTRGMVQQALTENMGKFFDLYERLCGEYEYEDMSEYLAYIQKFNPFCVGISFDSDVMIVKNLFYNLKVSVDNANSDFYEVEIIKR